MTATYDNTLPANLDHVRFLIEDTDTDTTMPIFQDEEITATLSEETATGAALKYFAAARLIGILRTRWAAGGKGITRKRVAELEIQYGAGAGVEEGLKAREAELRERGSYLLRSRSKVLKVI